MSACIFCNRVLTENIYNVYESINSTVLPYKDIQKLIPKTKLATLTQICIHCLYLVRVLNGFIEQLQNLIRNKSCINYSDAFDTFKGQINAINYSNSNQNNNSPEEDLHSHESEVEESNEDITQNVVNLSDEESDGEESNKDSELVVATHIVDYVENDTRRYTPASMEIQRALSRKRRNTKDFEEGVTARSKSPYSCKSTSMHVTVNDDGASISDVLRCTSTKLREPMYNRRNVEDFRYPCTLKKCSYKYESYDQLESHVITTHSKADQDIFFGEDYIKSYKAHMREEAQKVKLAVQPVYKGVLSQPRYSCDIDDCNATFRTLMKLSDHKRSQHNLMSLYKCSDCSLRAFTSQKDLDLHTEEAHYDIVVNCYYCAQQISNQMEWNYHMNMHPQFCCKYCDSYFLDADILKRHCREHYGRKNKKEYRQNTILKRIDIESDYRNAHVLSNDCGEFVRIRLQPGRRDSPLPEYICASLENTVILSETEVSDAEQELLSCDNSREDVTSVSEIDADSIVTIDNHQNIVALTDTVDKDSEEINDDSLNLEEKEDESVVAMTAEKGDDQEKVYAEQEENVQKLPLDKDKESKTQEDVEKIVKEHQSRDSLGIDESRIKTGVSEQTTETFTEVDIENNKSTCVQKDNVEAHGKSEIESIIGSPLKDNINIETPTISKSSNDHYRVTEKVDTIESKSLDMQNYNKEQSKEEDDIIDHQEVTEVKLLDQNVSKRVRKKNDKEEEEFRTYMNKCDIKFKKAIVIVEDCKGFIDKFMHSKAVQSTSNLDPESIEIADQSSENTNQNIVAAESSSISALEMIEPEEQQDVPELQSYLREEDSEVPDISAEIEISKTLKKGRLKNRREHASPKQGRTKQKKIFSPEENVAEQPTPSERIATVSPTATEMSDLQTNRKKRVRRPPKKYEQDDVVQFKKVYPNLAVESISTEPTSDVVEDQDEIVPQSFTEATTPSTEKFKKRRKGKARLQNPPDQANIEDNSSIIQRKKRKTDVIAAVGRRKKDELAETSDKGSGHSTIATTPEPVTPRKRLGMTNITKRLGRYRH